MNKDIMVRFYILSTDDAVARYHFVYRLCKKAFQLQQNVAIICENEAMMARLNTILWEQETDFFLPHTCLGDELDHRSPIILYCLPERVSHADILINLSNTLQFDLPPNCSKIFEIVINQAKILAATRSRYLQYKQLAFPIKTVTITSYSEKKQENNDEN